MSNSWTGREDKVGLIKVLLPITHKRLALGPAGEEGGLWLLPPRPSAPTGTLRTHPASTGPPAPSQPHDHQGCRATLLKGHRDVGTWELWEEGEWLSPLGHVALVSFLTCPWVCQAQLQPGRRAQGQTVGNCG